MKKGACDHCGQKKCKPGKCAHCNKKKECIANYMDPYAREINEEDVCMGMVCADCLEQRREDI